jgi:hypothetical protein
MFSFDIKPNAHGPRKHFEPGVADLARCR